MNDQSAGFADLLDAGDFEFVVVGVHHADVTGLAAHLGVEDGLVGDDEERVFLRVDFEDGGFDGIGLEADELGDGFGGDVEGADDVGFLCGACAFALLLHELFEHVHFDFDAVFLSEELGEIDGEAKGVVEFESDVSRKRGAHAPSRVVGDALVSDRAGRFTKLPAPGPPVIPRLRHQSIGERISDDIVIFFNEVGLAADQTIKGFLFPKMSDVFVLK